MKAILKLYLKGVYFISEEVELTANSDDLCREDNWTTREIELAAHIHLFKVKYLRQIIKCNYEDQVVVIFKSKLTENNQQWQLTQFLKK